MAFVYKCPEYLVLRPYKHVLKLMRRGKIRRSEGFRSAVENRKYCKLKAVTVSH